MGQAKNRGTRDDRVQQAKQRRKDDARRRTEGFERSSVRLAQLAVAMHQAHGQELSMADALKAAGDHQPPGVLEIR